MEEPSREVLEKTWEKKWKEALYYRKDDLVEAGVICQLCPRYCHLSDGQTGFCHARQNRAGRLYSLSYEKIGAYQLDPIEKKPLRRFRPGSSILSIGTFGCNLACDYCQNWELVAASTNTVTMMAERLVVEAAKPPSIGLAFTFNEPTVNYEYLLETAIQLKQKRLATVLVSNAYINPEPLQQLLPYLDAINFDLKAFTDDYYQKLCAGKLEPVKTAIRLAAKQTHLEVTTLIIEGYNSSAQQMEAEAAFLAEIDPEIGLHITGYYPCYKRNTPATDPMTLVKLRQIAGKYLKYVY